MKPFSFCLLYFTIFASVRVTQTSKAMQTTAIRTVANSLPENEVILLTLLISKRYIPYTDLLKISGLFRFTCIVCGIQCSELNYILLGEHLRCLYFYSQKRKMAESISMALPSLFFPHFDFTLLNVYKVKVVL